MRQQYGTIILRHPVFLKDKNNEIHNKQVNERNLNLIIRWTGWFEGVAGDGLSGEGERGGEGINREH